MKLSTRILLGFSIVLVLSVIDTASNYLLSIKVARNSEFLNRSQEIIRNSARLHKSIIDMESSFRGYLLTKDSVFLDSYNDGLNTVPNLLVEQDSLMKPNFEQSAILDSVKKLYDEWITYSNGLITARSTVTAPAPSSHVYL